VVKTAPNPVAVPSQVNWLRTLPAGPGLLMQVVNLNENSPIFLPDAINAFSPYVDELSSSYDAEVIHYSCGGLGRASGKCGLRGYLAEGGVSVLAA
jgi:hypothetical protein